MRRFYFNRTEDASGVSGTGRVAEGVEFDTGVVALIWLTPFGSMCFYPNICALEHVHSHGGKTKIEYVDSKEV